MDTKKISYEVKDKIAMIGFGHNCDKSMTVLDEATLRELDHIIDDVTKNQQNLEGVIFHSHKDRVFLAGADINLIASMQTESDAMEGAESGQSIFNKIEDLSIPTVACVHGVCLGGGMELSLSCKVILASDSSATTMGLPEVKLGLIPGFGGTYRMPRKVGLPAALDLILTGKGIDGRKAKKIGLVEETYPRDRLLTMAVKHFKKSDKRGSFRDSLEHLASDNFLTRKIIFQKARENVLKLTKGFYQAPLKILDVMEAGLSKRRTSYLASEAQAFGELCVSDQSKNLQHVFFLTESSKKYTGPKAKTKGSTQVLKKGAALGAGTMGGGIAWLMAKNHMAPIMKDLSTDALELGLKQSSQNFKGALKRRKMSFDDFERLQRSILPQTDYAGFKKVDLVIEAIVENMKIKKTVFSELEKEVRSDTLITSNTSSLSVEEMAGALENSARFAGLHFFNPVHRMPLVEIITHSQIAPETIEALHKWCLKVKKTPVIVKDGPGFLVNRILMPYLNEAGHLLSEGLSVEAIDEACLNFGMPMGPCRLLDEIGIDVAVKVSTIIHEGLGNRAKPSDLPERLVAEKFYGKKNNRGFYHYDEEGKAQGVNEDIAKFLPPKKIQLEEIDIQMRVFLPMINEAAYILGENLVQSAAEVDLGLIYGIGFPPFRGGLLRYADSEGPERILGAIGRYAGDVSSERYAASDYLKKMVSDKKKFYDH